MGEYMDKEKAFTIQTLLKAYQIFQLLNNLSLTIAPWMKFEVLEQIKNCPLVNVFKDKAKQSKVHPDFPWCLNSKKISNNEYLEQSEVLWTNKTLPSNKYIWRRTWSVPIHSPVSSWLATLWANANMSKQIVTNLISRQKLSESLANLSNTFGPFPQITAYSTWWI